MTLRNSVAVPAGETVAGSITVLTPHGDLRNPPASAGGVRVGEQDGAGGVGVVVHLEPLLVVSSQQSERQARCQHVRCRQSEFAAVSPAWQYREIAQDLVHHL